MSLDAQRVPRDNNVSQLRDSVKERINRVSDAETEDQKTGLYLVTTHLKNPIGKATVEQQLQYVIDTVPLVYTHILNKTVKSHKFESRRQLHPLMLSFIDYSGSRENQHNFSQLPHVHSILVVHPEVNSRFQDLRDNGFQLDQGNRNTARITNIDVVDIERTDIDLETVIDYSAKSYFLDFIPLVSAETKADMMIING